MWLTGRKGATEREAAQAVIAEAKSLIQQELGGLGIQWKTPQSNPDNGSNPDQTAMDCADDKDKSLTVGQSHFMKLKTKGSVSKRRSLSRKSPRGSTTRSGGSEGSVRLEKSVVISPPGRNSQNLRERK